ncbi:hypothetical protein T492DRAFT_856349 [Pavlovales sp. CCMP2436]|nr:hypothetical protein T492DRAFT_856349 [Pavlovales sp. CCMP2436]
MEIADRLDAAEPSSAMTGRAPECGEPQAEPSSDNEAERLTADATPAKRAKLEHHDEKSGARTVRVDHAGDAPASGERAEPITIDRFIKLAPGQPRLGSEGDTGEGAPAAVPAPLATPAAAAASGPAAPKEKSKGAEKKAPSRKAKDPAAKEAALKAKEGTKEAALKAKEEAKEVAIKAKEEAKETDRKAKEEAKETDRKAKEEAKETALKAKEEAKETERKAKEEAKETALKAKEEERDAARRLRESARDAEKESKEREKRQRELEQQAAQKKMRITNWFTQPAAEGGADPASPAARAQLLTVRASTPTGEERAAAEQDAPPTPAEAASGSAGAGDTPGAGAGARPTIQLRHGVLRPFSIQEHMVMAPVLRQPAQPPLEDAPA